MYSPLLLCGRKNGYPATFWFPRLRTRRELRQELAVRRLISHTCTYTEPPPPFPPPPLPPPYAQLVPPFSPDYILLYTVVSQKVTIRRAIKTCTEFVKVYVYLEYLVSTGFALLQTLSLRGGGRVIGPLTFL